MQNKEIVKYFYEHITSEHHIEEVCDYISKY